MLIKYKIEKYALGLRHGRRKDFFQGGTKSGSSQGSPKRFSRGGGKIPGWGQNWWNFIL